MKQIAVIIGIIVLLIFWQKKKGKAVVSVPANQEGIVQDEVVAAGSTGLDVRRLQMKLNELVARAVNEEIPVAYSTDGINYYPISQPLVVDGIFGKATETMLYAITGRKSVKASEIDGLTINFSI